MCKFIKTQKYYFSSTLRAGILLAGRPGHIGESHREEQMTRGLKKILKKFKKNKKTKQVVRKGIRFLAKERMGVKDLDIKISVLPVSVANLS